MKSVIVFLSLLFAASCGDATQAPPGAVPKLDRQTYEVMIEPMTEHLCAQVVCHGAADRTLRLHSRFGWRAEGALASSALEPDEIDANIANASRFLEGVEPLDTELLSKPLRIAAGGVGHRGGALFYDRSDPSYVLLACWVLGGTAEGAYPCRP